MGVVPQWLPHIAEAENMVVAQSMRLDASANQALTTWKFPGELLVLSQQWKAGNTGSDISEGSNSPGQNQLPSELQ